MATLTETKARPERKPLPAPNSDFYHLAETLPPDESSGTSKTLSE